MNRIQGISNLPAGLQILSLLQFCLFCPLYQDYKYIRNSLSGIDTYLLVQPFLISLFPLIFLFIIFYPKTAVNTKLSQNNRYESIKTVNLFIDRKTDICQNYLSKSMPHPLKKYAISSLTCSRAGSLVSHKNQYICYPYFHLLYTVLFLTVLQHIQ